jgi:hypothetical protein
MAIVLAFPQYKFNYPITTSHSKVNVDSELISLGSKYFADLISKNGNWPKLPCSPQNLQNVIELAQFRPTILPKSHIWEVAAFLSRGEPLNHFSLSDAQSTLIAYNVATALSLDLKVLNKFILDQTCEFSTSPFFFLLNKETVVAHLKSAFSMTPESVKSNALDACKNFRILVNEIVEESTNNRIRLPEEHFPRMEIYENSITQLSTELSSVKKILATEKRFTESLHQQCNQQTVEISKLNEKIKQQTLLIETLRSAKVQISSVIDSSGGKTGSSKVSILEEDERLHIENENLLAKIQQLYEELDQFKNSTPIPTKRTEESSFCKAGTKKVTNDLEKVNQELRDMICTAEHYEAIATVHRKEIEELKSKD